MGFFSTIKRIFTGGDAAHKALIRELKGLPKDKLPEASGAGLHNLCLKYATTFVHEELNKPDSPFKNSHKSNFLQEMVIVNYWIVDKVLACKKKIIMEHLHNNYFKSFHVKDVEIEKNRLLNDRYAIYHQNWDDDIGDHKEFGLKVAENIYGEGKEYPGEIASCWIIFYTDSTIKKFENLRSALKSAKIKV